MRNIHPYSRRACLPWRPVNCHPGHQKWFPNVCHRALVPTKPIISNQHPKFYGSLSCKPISSTVVLLSRGLPNGSTEAWKQSSDTFEAKFRASAIELHFSFQNCSSHFAHYHPSAPTVSQLRQTPRTARTEQKMKQKASAITIPASSQTCGSHQTHYHPPGLAPTAS